MANFALALVNIMYALVCLTKESAKGIGHKAEGMEQRAERQESPNDLNQHNDHNDPNHLNDHNQEQRSEGRRQMIVVRIKK